MNNFPWRLIGIHISTFFWRRGFSRAHSRKRTSSVSKIAICWATGHVSSSRYAHRYHPARAEVWDSVYRTSISNFRSPRTCYLCALLPLARTHQTSRRCVPRLDASTAARGHRAGCGLAVTTRRRPVATTSSHVKRDSHWHERISRTFKTRLSLRRIASRFYIPNGPNPTAKRLEKVNSERNAG